MVTLSIVIPSYNSQDYLHRCLDSMLPADQDVEIIVVNDGSTDETPAIAESYAEDHPGQVRLLNKPNGGHGSAVNAGVAAARGEFVKVVDSDDWVDRGALASVLRTLRDRHDPVDLVVTNFVYEKEEQRRKHVMRYTSVLPTATSVGWDDVGRFRPSQALLMHSLTYRTQVLRDSGLRLPEHTFYVDNLYAFVPLTHVRRLRYLDVNLYRYHIGREDQSVNERIMLRRLDQQARVNRQMIHELPAHDEVPASLHRYLVHYLGMVTAISSIMMIRSGSSEHLAEKQQLWAEIREADARAHRRLRRSPAGVLLNLPGRSGRGVSVLAYRLARRVVGFN